MAHSDVERRRNYYGCGPVGDLGAFLNPDGLACASNLVLTWFDQRRRPGACAKFFDRSTNTAEVLSNEKDQQAQAKCQP
jgi:hypothetical protein